MDEATFFATLIMMGWKKHSDFQFTQRIKGRNIIIMSRRYNVLIMNSGSPEFRDQINVPVSFARAMDAVNRDFDL